MTALTPGAGRGRAWLAGAIAAVISLVVAGGALLSYDQRGYREQALEAVAVQGKTLAAVVTPALVFDDPKAIREYADVFRANPNVEAVAIYAKDGTLIANAVNPGAPDVPRMAPLPGPRVEGDYILVTKAVVQGDDTVGYVHLRAITEPVTRRLSRYAGLVLLLVMGSVALAILVAAQSALRRTNAELNTTNAQLREQIEHRERAEETLRQVQKMEAIGQLTGGIAHDFNNMLAIILGSLTILKRRLSRGDHDVAKYADGAIEGAQRAASLTQRLLAFARRQPLTPQPTDINRLVSGMSELLRRTLGESIQVETVLAGGAWRINIDPPQLENAIVNLAINGRDAMPDGGRLTIETANVHLDDAYVAAFPGLNAGQYAMVAVSDTGSGMSTDVVERAFEPFFTTKTVGKGTGLGLSQVYGFVRQSGGHVKIYSERDRGTTVRIYLPRLFGSGDAPDIDHGSAPRRIVEGVTILVVEDEASVRRLSIEALIELGYRTLEADGAAAALQLIDRHPEIKLLFTDIVMPEVDGRRLADEALRRRPDLKVLFTTGYTPNAVVHNGVVDHGVQLLTKPFSIEQLAAKVSAVLEP